MAIDTRDKRASVLLQFRTFPNPDGDLAIEGDRIHVGGIYRGITPSGLQPEITNDNGLFFFRRPLT